MRGLGGSITAILASSWALFSSAAFPQEIHLVPAPREVERGGPPFELQPGVPIVVEKPSPEDRFAAQLLSDEIKAETGLTLPVVFSSRGARRTVRLGRLGEETVDRVLAAAKIPKEGISNQGYALLVERDGVLVAGADAAGLYYGVRTLAQLAVADPAPQIPAVRIRDWPSLPHRGTQVDLARGPVPTLAYLKEIVGTISEFKMNELYLYMEDSFRLEGQPFMGLLDDTLSHEDLKALVAYASLHHVDLIPATEACGHLHKVLRFEEYSSLGERPHGHGLASGDENALQFLEGMYKELEPVFPSRIYHIGCDETFDLGLGRTAARVAEEGYGKVYVENLAQVADLVRRHKKKVMFWGDIAVEHPDMIPFLPSDLLVASWEYGVHPSYEAWLKPFSGTGLSVFVSPWVANTGVMVADYKNAAANISGFLRDGKRAGAIGTDVTVWNDDGETLYGGNWWSIVYGAACAWQPAEPSFEDFNREYDWAFYRNTDHRFADAIQSLSGINELLRGLRPDSPFDLGYGGTDDELFWRDPFTEEGLADGTKAAAVAGEMRRLSEAAYRTFTKDISRARRHTDSLRDLSFGALRLDALGMRYEFMREISKLYSRAVEHQHDKDGRLTGNELEEIEGMNGRLEDLRDYTTRLRELYEKAWLSENLPDWLPNMLQLYDRNSQLWQARIAEFQRIRAGLGTGTPLPSPESLGLWPVE